MMMMMMSLFYRKTLHSFLPFPDTLSPKSSLFKSHIDQQHSLGLGLISDNNDFPHFKSPNVLQSFSVVVIKPVAPPPRKDPGGVGFIDDIGGGVDGLMSCTESLGFESSDERLVNDREMMRMEEDNDGGCGCGGGGGGARTVRRRKVVERKFPPPLTSLNRHGHPNFYLRPVRKDGRLELTEIWIERPEILRASREDGRLRLHLINQEKQEDVIEEQEEDEEKEEEIVESSFVKEGKMEFRRCVEVANHQRRREHHRGHHQHLDVWRQHCVTTS